MYILNNNNAQGQPFQFGYPTNTLGETTITKPKFDLEQAIRLNRSFAQSLGWQDKMNTIVRILGFTDITPNESRFAEAVANWQQENELPIDGVVDPKTWNKMQISLLSDLNAVNQSTPSFSSEPTIQWKTSPNFSNRKGQPITAIIYHYTAGSSLNGAVNWFARQDSKVSAHYVVGKNGEIVQMVPLDKAAWHAGKSVLAGKRGVNLFSVGIEIVNWGRLTRRGNQYFTHSGKPYYGKPPIQIGAQYWEPFTAAQYKTIAWLTRHLILRIPTITHITGHQRIALPKGRKIDPGDGFDWNRIQLALRVPYGGYFGP
jgi:N-acetyl-anhydromuramyl-L-alanine amidase AmpD